LLDPTSGVTVVSLLSDGGDKGIPKEVSVMNLSLKRSLAGVIGTSTLLAGLLLAGPVLAASAATPVGMATATVHGPATPDSAYGCNDEVCI
jgi:hypothetical protein